MHINQNTQNQNSPNARVRSIAVTVGKAKCVNKGVGRRLGPAFDYYHTYLTTIILTTHLTTIRA